MIGTMVASIHSIPDTVPAAGIRNISTLTGMKNSMASQNSRLLERPPKLHVPMKKRLTASMKPQW